MSNQILVAAYIIILELIKRAIGVKMRDIPSIIDQIIFSVS